ncbi:hypothetical protein GIB67_022117 [Kingdonia uniflora]|uniref:U-box domain-containing protein n=1 Tax=Kingdonia uniflora TaxID=39325 RepID=A0A7J7LXY1_9MAGN|nr:hypothetical protein GIB67_022117 [Kingdonia uniflora]
MLSVLIHFNSFHTFFKTFQLDFYDLFYIYINISTLQIPNLSSTQLQHPTSGNIGAKENSATTLFSLSVLEDYKIKIGRSVAVKSLANLLESGTLRGKKDAATTLFNLSIFHENKARIVQAGAVKYLIELMDPETGMVDKAIALLANLSTIPEGCSAIAREGGILILVEVVETGSDRGKENAASILMQLYLHSHKLCNLVLQEGAIPPLVALSQSGTLRARQKAQQILSHFHSQREGIIAEAKS